MVQMSAWRTLSSLFLLRNIQVYALQLSEPKLSSSGGQDRRSALHRVAGTLAGGLLAKELINPLSVLAHESTDPNFDVYRVIPDASASLNPSLVSLDANSFLSEVSSSKGGALWLGEHHNAAKDHNLQAEIIRQVHALRSKKGPIAVGLEQVQLQFQPVLDDYIAGRISAVELRKGVQWDKRWIWPFEVYEPVFATAQELCIPLVALNVDSEDLAMVEKDGLPGLPRDRLRQYIDDAQGFADFVKPKEYSAYVDYVIRPSFDLHEAMGLLKYTISGEKLEEDMSFRNFFSGRILWDESMAKNAHAWSNANPGGLIVGLVGADHVKFRNGIPGRFSRMAAGSGRDCISVMLNPTLIDTRPSGTVADVAEAYTSQNPDKITLQLRYLKEGVDSDSRDDPLPAATGGVLPLADYLVIDRL